MKLREFNFNSIKDTFSLVGLCVMEAHSFGEDFVSYECGGIGETLKALPIEWADRQIKETRWFFNVFVIEVI